MAQNEFNDETLRLLREIQYLHREQNETMKLLAERLHKLEKRLDALDHEDQTTDPRSG